MFSGIVEAIGVVTSINSIHDCIAITISPSIHFSDLKIGDSVSVNGICLTVTHLTGHDFSAVIVPETLRVTNLGKLNIDSEVNLERSLRMADRIGGHYVQGHIDTVGTIIEMKMDGEQAKLVKIAIPSHLEKYIVRKGYIAVDGMSLTVIDVDRQWFTLTLIPHTQAASIAKHYQNGTTVNIEVDILSKYTEKLLRGQHHASISSTC